MHCSWVILHVAALYNLSAALPDFVMAAESVASAEPIDEHIPVVLMLLHTVDCVWLAGALEALAEVQ
jgi:hypothetical protein